MVVARNLLRNYKDRRALVMTTTTDEQQFADAVAIANIPTLLMVLVQLTGEQQLDATRRTARRAGGAWATTTSAACPSRSSRRSATPRWRPSWRGGPAGRWPSPSRRRSMLVEMLSCAMGEDVPARVRADDRRAARRSGPSPRTGRSTCPRASASSIIGAGVVGPVRRRQPPARRHPVRHRREEHQPSAAPGGRTATRAPASTRPNHLYSFSFATYDWSKYFALRDELHAYLEHVADTLRPAPTHPVRHRGRVGGLRGGRPAAGPSPCAGPTAPPRRSHANVVISGTGIFNPLKFPDITGLDRFEGPCVPHRGVAERPRPHRQAGRHHRQRRQLHADRPGDPGHGGLAHHLPALAALGGAVRAVPQGGARPDALPAPRGADVPGVVPGAARVDVQRPHLPGAAEGPGLGAPRALAERHQRRPPRVLHPVHPRRARRPHRSARRRSCRRTRRSASGC